MDVQRARTPVLVNQSVVRQHTENNGWVCHSYLKESPGDCVVFNLQVMAGSHEAACVAQCLLSISSMFKSVPLGLLWFYLRLIFVLKIAKLLVRSETLIGET